MQDMHGIIIVVTAIQIKGQGYFFQPWVFLKYAYVPVLLLSFKGKH